MSIDTMTEDDICEVMNLGLNVSAYCNGDYSKKMPITQEEWDLVISWEVDNNALGTISKWMEVME